MQWDEYGQVLDPAMFQAVAHAQSLFPTGLGLGGDKLGRQRSGRRPNDCMKVHGMCKMRMGDALLAIFSWARMRVIAPTPLLQLYMPCAVGCYIETLLGLWGEGNPLE